jgi:hypothetical protein
MITSAKEYLSHLQQIRNENLHKEVLQIPADEQVYAINLNARTVDSPVYLSTESDHTAETVFFTVDRYFETHDLADSTCIIQYINAKGKSFVYVVPIYDLETYADEGKILIPWVIQGNATAASGTIRYAVRFFHLSQVERYNGEIEYDIDYIVNTQIAQSKILKGMGETFLNNATSPLEEVATIGDWEILYQDLVELLKNPDEENPDPEHPVRGALSLYWVVLPDN